MKKICLCLSILGLGLVAVSAQSTSAGFGMGLSSESNVLRGNLFGYGGSNTFEATLISAKFVFDATYLEASLGLQFWASGRYEDNNFLNSGRTQSITNFEVASMPLTLMFKYPLEIGDRVRVFPAFGIEYDVNLAYVDRDLGIEKYDLSLDEQDDLNHFFIKAGIGADISLGGNLYLRPSMLLAYKLQSKYERALVYFYQTQGYTNVTLDTFKLDIGLALMYTF